MAHLTNVNVFQYIYERWQRFLLLRATSYKYHQEAYEESHEDYLTIRQREGLLSKLLATLKLEGIVMDKQINKIKKDLNKGEKDTKKLLKMDKVQDRKVEKCEKKMKKKK